MSIEININGAPVELLDIGQLALLHDKTKSFDTWLLDTFFPRRASFERDEVPVGELETETPIAPYVSPSIKGRPIAGKGQADVKYVKPAYLKPREMIEPTKVFDSVLVDLLRQSGIVAYGSNRISEADALRIDQIQKYKRLHDSIDVRKVMMGVELLLTGKIVIESDDFPEYIVDYGRDAACTYAPAVKWDAVSGATPVADIQAMIDISVDKAGSSPIMALQSSKVFNSLIKNPEFKEKFITPYAGISVPIPPGFDQKDKPQYRGEFGGIKFWTYDVTYKLGGTVKRFIPTDYFSLISDVSGIVAQCAIKNLKAFGQPLAYFDDQWYENDPSGIHMLCESAPLIVPSNKNGVVGGQGFVTA